jgi:hypothetical protein
MKYDMLSQETVKRVWETFTSYDECINTKYKSFALDGDYDLSDRDRFVDKFFTKFIGKYIAFMDVQKVGAKLDNFAYFQQPESVYAPMYGERDYTIKGEAITRVQKKYLYIDGFRAVNMRYGYGYIEMSCTDTFYNKFSVQLDYNNMRHIQFKEITKKEFERVAKLFQDDRSEIPFIVTRYLTWDEMKRRNLIDGTEPVKEEVKVMAKDMKEASQILPNVIEVRRL